MSKKIKTALIIFALITVSAIAAGMFLLKSPALKPVPDPILKDLLYQSEDEKIPDEYLLTGQRFWGKGTLENELISEDSEKGEFFCKQTQTNAEIVEYFYNSGRRGEVGGWSYRAAVVCHDVYWIIDGHASYGELIYGPFYR